MSGRRRQGPFTPEQMFELSRGWWIIGLCALAGASVVAGAFDPTSGGWLWQAVVIVGLIAAGVHERRVAGEGFTRHPFGAIEGPLVWMTGAFVIMRLAGAHGGELLLLPAALVAWWVATRPVEAWAVPVIYAGALELGLAAAGRQGWGSMWLHVILAAGLSWVARRLLAARGRGRVFVSPPDRHTRMTQAPSPIITGPDGSAPDSVAGDFGLLTAQAAPIRTLPALSRLGETPTMGRITLDFLETSFAIHLDLLRQTLGLMSAVILWRGAEGQVLKIRGVSTARNDLLEGPFSVDRGAMAEVFREGQELALVGGEGGPPPYYRGAEGVGAFFATALINPEPEALEEGALPMPLGALCVDRLEARPWTEAERQILRLTARKIALDVQTGRALTDTDRARRDIHRFCAGLRALNGVLGLDEVAGAALDAAAALVPFDFGAVTVFDGDLHKVVMVRGEHCAHLEALTFAPEEGLVGEAVQARSVRPTGGAWRGARPIFTADDRLGHLGAVLVVPLIKKGSGAQQLPLGALVVGSTHPEAYDDRRREMVELVADQVAIKLDLAQAHEQIREMATLDGLTGLANHRVFQQAFDNMLNRATRASSNVCMILTDIDRFKSVNDTYGHPFGDVVLKAVAKVLGGAVRKVDLAARYGGEEFAILLEDSDEAGGLQMAERIRHEVQALRFEHEGRPVQVTLSLGVAAYPDHGLEKADLIARADEALYHAKRSGRNRTVTASDLVEVVAAGSR